MPFTLPQLEYAADALEPHIDARTMEIHHAKHHAAYVAKANEALAGTAFAEDTDPANVCRNLRDLPAEKMTAVRNNAGGHWNHSFFWSIMGPGGGGAPAGALASAIESAFGSFEAFRDQFIAAGVGRFGSGWAWLYADAGRLHIGSTANQDNPLMGAEIAGIAGTPIIGVDVWEHAYYLNYQNRRPDYLGAWFNTIDWAKAAERFAAAE